MHRPINEKNAPKVRGTSQSDRQIFSIGTLLIFLTSFVLFVTMCVAISRGWDQDQVQRLFISTLGTQIMSLGCLLFLKYGDWR